MINRHHFSILCVSILFICTSSCKQSAEYPEFKTWQRYDETALINANENPENDGLDYKLIQSPVLDKNELLENIRVQLDGFTESKYVALAPLVFENSIEQIQTHIHKGKLSYKELTQWYLYRIAILETDKELGLNTVIAIHPNAVKQAEKLDDEKASKKHSIFGMPILLKDNINTADMNTTAGALALLKNQPKVDAEIVSNLKSKGAIILGKVNLSEWANFLCDGCPNGYSAIGGQTLNPYGARIFDTGGSSSGSAASVAANYAVGAVGSETSGSILSPASQQSVVGLKPTVKNLSQNGIIPISSTLDTPGPITKNVADNAILYSAMRDENASKISLDKKETTTLRLGVIEAFLQDSLYNQSVELLRTNGVHLEILQPKPMDFSGFLELLNGDMKRDLKAYLAEYASDAVEVADVQEVIKFNLTDSTLHIPYGQARLDGIVAQELTDQELDSIRQKLITSGKNYFNEMMDVHELDAIISINNYNAGQAAVAMYPAITVPMGYTAEGEPMGLTFIAKTNQEIELLRMAQRYELLSKNRRAPVLYDF